MYESSNKFMVTSYDVGIEFYYELGNLKGVCIISKVPAGLN